MLTRSIFLNRCGFSAKGLLSIPVRNLSSAERIKELREYTGSPISECKKALENFEGDVDKAKKWLREQGSAYADK